LLLSDRRRSRKRDQVKKKCLSEVSLNSLLSELLSSSNSLIRSSLLAIEADLTSIFATSSESSNALDDSVVQAAELLDLLILTASCDGSESVSLHSIDDFRAELPFSSVELSETIKE